MSEENALHEFDTHLAVQLARDIRINYGFDVQVQNGHVIMSDLAWKNFESLVWADRRLDALGRGYYLGAVPIDVRPAWMFDPLTVAWLRFIATVIIGLRLRRITAWLARHLTTKGAPHV